MVDLGGELFDLGGERLISAGQGTHPYCFHPTVAAFGHCSGLSVENRPCRSLGVGGVGLAQPAAQLPVGGRFTSVTSTPALG